MLINSSKVSSLAAMVPYSRNTYASWYIRQDWLDKLGLKSPKNYEELTNVLTQFTKADPDGNGKQDTYGFTAAGSGQNLPFDFPQWLNNGFVADFMIVDNSYVDNRTDLKVQGVIDQVVEWNKAGIVDPDWFLNKPPAHMDKAAQGRVGMFFTPATKQWRWTVLLQAYKTVRKLLILKPIGSLFTRWTNRSCGNTTFLRHVIDK